MKASKALIALFTLLFALLPTLPAHADQDKHQPFPPPVPDKSHHCDTHACTLVCTVRGDDDDDDARSAGHLRWRYIHGAEDSKHVKDWMAHHPQDFYYGDTVFHWICTDHAVFMMQVVR